MNRFMYSQLAVLTGLKIVIGKEKPLVQFTVEKDPPSIYWVYRLLPGAVQEAGEKLGIPAGFSLCPIRCLDSDEPAYLVVVNAYRVSGLANGIRAEWSVFVRDTDGTPRYMVLDARSSTRSVDPVNVITSRSTVVHEMNGNSIRTQIGDGENAFISTITIPEDAPRAVTSAEWVTANDYIYWRNGIRDRSFYNAGLANSRQLLLKNTDCVIEDGSYWGRLVEPEPVHVLVHDSPIEFVLSPWENVDTIHRKK